MAANLIAKAETDINVPAHKVWLALTTPELISEYLFGTQTQTNWAVGSPIVFTGNYQGKAYVDKGTILQNLPDKLLQYSYHSSMSGLEDIPENYFNVSYLLEEDDNRTHLTIKTENLPNDEARKHSEQNWKMVLAKIKDVAERQTESYRINE